MKTNYTSIDHYISEQPLAVQPLLEKIRTTIREVAPEATEVISYQIPTFKMKKNLVHFAAFKNHIGFYPGAEAIVAFEKELGSYKTSKGAIQFPIENPLPLAIITKITQYRISSILQSKR